MKKQSLNKNNYDASVFDRPSLTVDIVLFSIENNDLKTLLIKRNIWPYKNHWALPGGFVKPKETLEQTAARELKEETGLSLSFSEQLYTFSKIDRDPRTRVITVAYFALMPNTNSKLNPTTDASAAAWHSIKKLPDLAFDHQEIIQYALQRLRSKLYYSNIVKGLLAKDFTMSQLQATYEIVLGKKLDKRNFRKKMHSLNLFVKTGKKQLDGSHRPAELYHFKNRKLVYFA